MSATDTIVYSDILKRRPDLAMPATSRECAPAYWRAVARGEALAAMTDVTILGLARNAMPWLELNCMRLERLASRFRSWRAFVYENDSTDGSQAALLQWADRCPNATVRCETNGRPQLSTEKSRRRTDALAEYRNRCLRWAADNRPREAREHRIIVIDLDCWGGWSDDGVMTGLAWLDEIPDAAGMASVSTVEFPSDQHPGGKLTIHYDAWAFRLNHWTEHDDMGWFHGWFPPVGSDPVPCRSAFGGLCIYKPRAFFAGHYTGGDCEHVLLHKQIAESTGLRMYLNPSQRSVMAWIPGESATDGRQHGDNLDAGVSG